METNRTPPNNLEAEQSVLGSIMIDNEAFSALEGKLLPEHFYKEKHRKIFRCFEKIYLREEPIDLVTVTEELRQASELDGDLNVSYLIGITEGVPTAAYAQTYAKVVKEKSILRDLISASGQIMQKSYDDLEDLVDIIDFSESSIIKVAKNSANNTYESITDLAYPVLEKIHANINQGDAVTGLPMGFPDLDKMTSGLQKGDFNLLAARSSQGKTALALDIAQHVALIENKPVGIFSLESKPESLIQRMISSGGRVDLKNIYKTGGTDRDLRRIENHTKKLAESGNIFIDGSTGLTAFQIRSMARKMFTERGIELIIIDHFHEMRHNGENETLAMKDSALALRGLARELDIPVLCLAQLSRGLEARANKRPMLSDLRQSGALEEIADLVMFIYRDEYYDPHTEKQGIAEVIIGKQREGPVGMIELQFHNSHVRFNSLAQEPETDKKEKAKQNKKAQNTSQNLDDVYRGG